VFLDSGGFDEELKDNQDHELGLRLLERGVPFAYYPAAKAWHHLDARLTTALRQARAQGRADVQFATKHPHVKGRLRFAYYPGPGGGVSGRHALAYRHAERAEQLTPLGLDALDRLEALKLPRTWSRLVSALATVAYIRGMKAALPTPDQFQVFVGSIPRDDGGDTLNVRLDAPAPLRLPRRQTPVEVSVALDGVPIARTPAIEPELQWNWDALSTRVVDAAPRRLAQQDRALSPLLGEADREPQG
jgi:hypothetical protein